MASPVQGKATEPGGVPPLRRGLVVEYTIQPARAKFRPWLSAKFPPKTISSHHRIPGTGPMPCAVMIIGARPGEDEAYYDQSFVGATGEELERYLNRSDYSGGGGYVALEGMKRSDVYLTNVVKTFRPGNPEPTQEEITRDERLLMAEIAKCDPRLIVALGAPVVRYFLGPGAELDSIHGVPYNWQADGIKDVTVLPAIQPAQGLYSPDVMALIQDDFCQIPKVLSGLIKPRHDDYAGEEEYTEIEIVLPFYDVPLVAVDTEGWRGKPWSLQFSFSPGFGFVIRKQSQAQLEQFREEAHRLWARYGRLILHNAMHDFEVLRDLGINVPDEGYWDTMVFAYILQLEPQGLKALAKRHCGMEMQSYEELVAPAQERHALEYLLQLDSIDWGPAEEYVIIERVKRKKKDKATGQMVTTDLGEQAVVKKPWSINKRIKRILDDLGKDEGTDIRGRWHKVCSDYPEVEEQVEARVGPMPTATLDDIPLEKAVYYAGRDPDATYRVFPILWEKITTPGKDGRSLLEIAKLDHSVLPMLERMQYIGMPADPAKFEILGKECDRRMAEAKVKIQQCTGASINPDSPNQVRELLYEQLEIKQERKTKKTKAGSTDDKALEAIRGEHEAVGYISDYREASKIKNSFVTPLPRLLERDRRIHCTIRGTRVVSGRIAATNPNLTAIPVRTEFGKEVRGCFVAPEGRKLGSWDLDQIEMREMAHQSGDEKMIEFLSNPKYDIHCETAARAFGLTINERADNKKERYANIDPLLHRYAAKRVGFGVITGITGKGLKAQMDVAGATKNGKPWTEEQCDELIHDYLHVIYPRVWKYIQACRDEAQYYGYVKCRYGRIRYLAAVYSDNRTAKEEALRQSHSHKISASAQGVIKTAMAELWQVLKCYWEDGRYIEPLLQIHDELVFEIEDDPILMKEWDETVVNCMCNAAKLDVPIKAKGGYAQDWGQLKD